MKHATATVSAVDRQNPWTWITIEEAEVTRQLSPGQFVMADLQDGLRHPLFPARVTPEGFDLLVPSDHPAACLQEGASLDLMGPLGRGFRYDKTARRWLLVASSNLLPMALTLVQDATEAQLSMAILLMAPTVASLYPIRWLPPSIEVHISTADGSAGSSRSHLEVFRDLVGWADRVFVVTERGLHSALAREIEQSRMAPTRDFAQALVVPTMVCGAGVCQSCAVAVLDGIKLACTDGPVFDLLELRTLL